ncbi:MAG: pyridoxamine 5'-phosphate oxidase [Bacteroidales bacterium]|nr:pyridoxamine 5'-phosphate oxidase [Bacteroidales bacterium]
MSEFFNKGREYRLSRLEIDMLDHNPYVQFQNWLQEAIQAEIPDPTAMSLSTSTPGGRPSSRIILLKDLNPEGFVFFTNYESKKGSQINENPLGALLFFWPELERQVRIEGRISKIISEKSDEYFYSRPQGGKISAWASPQSQPIPNREYLENLQEDYQKLFKTRELKRPGHWGGYMLKPDLFEFWQGRANRLHDRFEYNLKGHIWEIHRLAP